MTKEEMILVLYDNGYNVSSNWSIINLGLLLQMEICPANQRGKKYFAKQILHKSDEKDWDLLIIDFERNLLESLLLEISNDNISKANI